MTAQLETFFDGVDVARTQRVRELLEIKRLFSDSQDDPLGVKSKALVVLCYAAWEGFFNDCVELYCEALQSCGKRVVDAGWPMLLGVLGPDFNSLRSRDHSQVARRDFIEKLQNRLQHDFSGFDRKTVKARSNLDWEKLSENFHTLGFDTSPLQVYRNRLDKEVVRWRHGVAHGDAPNLDAMDSSDHVELIMNALTVVSDVFQESMLRHL